MLNFNAEGHVAGEDESKQRKINQQAESFTIKAGRQEGQRTFSMSSSDRRPPKAGMAFLPFVTW